MKSFSKFLDHFETGIVSITLSAMTIAIFLQIFFRTAGSMAPFLASHHLDAAFLVNTANALNNISGKILFWTEELARFLMIWTVFIGAGMGAKQGAHVGIEAFINLFPVKVTKFALLLSGFISMIFSLLIAIFGTIIATEINRRGQVSPAIGLPMVFVYAAAPIGGLLLAFHFMVAGVEKYHAYTGKEIKNA